ncbi:hypothetical protein [Brevundimonas sp.]|uniref:hypothetical protein n=1 Tax=Brevundimonas sp. TaxID=1871086 RepID=UPI0035B39A28
MIRKGLASLLLLATTGCDGDHWSTGIIEREVQVHAGVGEALSIIAVDEGRYVSVEGVWTIEGDDRIAAPINVSRVTCKRDSDPYCEVMRAGIYTFSGGRPTLTLDTDIYDVTEWTDGAITAVSRAGCRTVTLRLSQAENSVTELTTGTATCDDPLGLPLDKPRLARLISGAELEAKRRRGEPL